VGEIKGGWLPQEQKADILATIEEGKEKGIPIGRLCAMWRINRRRVVRWRGEWKKDERCLCNLKPGPKHPVHKLLPEEKASVLLMAGREEYADLAHRILAVEAWEREIFYVSFSSVYRILRTAGLMSMRGTHRHHNGNSIPPIRKALTGPNQRWCWDISYLLTFERGMFFYLHLLLDEYSRKVIRWLISWHQGAEEARHLLESGLMDENILDLPEEARPEVINDRGRQMKAKSIKRMFDSRFLDLEAAVEYFDHYFPWYNTEHYHSGIDYVTPDQCHRGLRGKIVAERRGKLESQRQLRKEVNRIRLGTLTDDGRESISLDQSMACSVISS